MKKSIFLTLIVTLATLTAVEARPRHYYSRVVIPVERQSEFILGGGFGVDSFGSSTLYMHTVQGVWLNQYISTGIGLGVNYAMDDSELYMPIYYNVKGYLPLTTQSSLFLSLDLGYSALLSGSTTPHRGLYTSPAIGVSFRLSPTHAINVSLSLDSQRVESSIKGIYTTSDALALRIGFLF